MNSYQDRKKKKSSFPFIILIAFWIALYFFITYNNCTSKVLFDVDTIFEVKEWMTFSTLIKNNSCPSWTSKLYLKGNTPNFQLQKWIYNISGGTTLKTLFSQLQKPINDDIKITILEGWNIYDIDILLTGKWLIKKWEFLSYISDNLNIFKKEYSFLKPAISLEWFLYPDTYYINPNTFSMEQFTKKLLENFDTKVMQNIDFWSDENVYKVVNLASIVEKEEKNKTEKANVAGVLKKRMREGWMIWADATVCYPYKLISDDCTPNFIVNHIDDKNDYNTRTMLGLPKTPISNPSFETIQATLDWDETTPYYFYLHDNKWWIHYGKTNAEHEENKRKYIY
jgi:UPF0755 protein